MTLPSRAPEPLNAGHDRAGFDCGLPALDDWLVRRALANQMNGASRCFVVTGDAHEVLAYYALAAGAIAHRDATGAIRRNMPDPVPVMVLGRLAVDRRVQGRRLGGALLKDAVRRSLAVADNAGVRALLVHAMDDTASGFYEHYGFQPSPADPLLLMLRLSGLRP